MRRPTAHRIACHIPLATLAERAAVFPELAGADATPG